MSRGKTKSTSNNPPPPNTVVEVRYLIDSTSLIKPIKKPKIYAFIIPSLYESMYARYAILNSETIVAKMLPYEPQLVIKS